MNNTHAHVHERTHSQQSHHRRQKHFPLTALKPEHSRGQDRRPDLFILMQYETILLICHDELNIRKQGYHIYLQGFYGCVCLGGGLHLCCGHAASISPSWTEALVSPAAGVLAA